MRMPTSKISFEEALPRLVSLSIFDDFSAKSEEDVEMFKALYEKFSAESYDDGDLIIKEGDSGQDLYILYEENVQARKRT